jgi:hypothetical protein
MKGKKIFYSQNINILFKYSNIIIKLGKQITNYKL